MHAHHGDLGAHGKTEKHPRNAAPFSNTHTRFDAGVSLVKVGTSVKMSELIIRACMPACLCVPRAYTYAASEGHNYVIT